MLALKDLRPHPKNRNKHPPEQIDRFCKILKEQGIRRPVRISNLSGYITAGHGLLLAAKKLKLKELPCDFQDYADGAQEYADIQADNALAAWAELDFSGINADIGDLGPDFDIDLLGIKNFSIDVADKEPQCDEDEVPEKVEPKTRLGDLYTLGDHRLMCGDSTSIDAVEKLMNGTKADICFTSPPYNVGGNGVVNGQKTGKKYLKNSDEKSSEKYFDFLTENINICLSYASEVFYNIQLLGANKTVIIDILSKYKGQFKDIIYWVKDNAPPHIEPGIMSSFVEMIICLSIDNNTKKFHKTSAARGSLKNKIVGPSNAGNEYAKIHAAAFPIYLPESIINDFSKPGMAVMDTFGGTGTTMIACEKTNRKCFMMELDPHYCDVIVARWEKYTGKKAVLNGETEN